MATPIRKCCSFFASSYQLLTKIKILNVPWENLKKKFSIVLEKFTVNVEVSKKEGTVYKAQGNLILVLSRYLTYKKMSRIKFTRLKNHL